MPKISALPQAGTLTGAEILPMVQSGITVEALLSSVSTYVLAQAGGGMTPSGPAGGDLTGTYPNPTIGAGKVTGAKIAAATVANSNLAVMNNNTVKGNVSGGSAGPVDLTQAQVTALINAFTAVLSGAVPASGGGTTNFLRADATWAAPAAGAAVSTQQVFLSGSGATYTTGVGARQIKIRAWAGGGGGGAVATNNGSTGGVTIFNSIQAAGGLGGKTTSSGSVPGGAGGTGGTGTANVRIPGFAGGSAADVASPFTPTGGSGGGPGGGIPSVGDGAGGNAVANSGGGGAGATSGGGGPGGGGGSGEYFELIINSPAATYTYTIGAGGNGGAAGGFAGGNGGSGLIVVDEYY